MVPPFVLTQPVVAIPGKGVRCQCGQFGMRASPYAPPNIVPSRELDLPEEANEKMEGTFYVQKLGKCRRKGFCFVLDKRNMASEHVEIICF